MLLLLHNFVVKLRQLHDCVGWTKQALLARVVGCFTGIKLRASDAEYIGNAQDYYLRDYVRLMTKAHKSQRMARSRAEKLSKQLPPHFDARVKELEQRIYTCKFGGVPRNLVVGGAAQIGREAVPFRKVQDVNEVNLQLQREIQVLKRARETSREMQSSMSVLCNAIDRHVQAVKAAERAAENAEALQA